MVQIVGCCHPKARNNAYVGPQLTQKRMRSEWMHLRGLPLLDNHDKRKQVGRILEAWVDGEDQLWIRAEVDESTAMGAETARRIRSGEYRGLSLGMRHGVDDTLQTQSSSSNSASSSASSREPGWEGVREVFWSNIEEVSVCERGKWPNTVLHSHFSEDPDLAPSASKENNNNNNANDSGITLFLSLPAAAAASENNKKSSGQSDNPTQPKPACITTDTSSKPLTPFADSFQKFYHQHQQQRKVKMSEQSVPMSTESSSTPTTAATLPVPDATTTPNSKGHPSPLPRETDGRFSAYLSTRGASFLCVCVCVCIILTFVFFFSVCLCV